MSNNVYIGNRYVPKFANPVEWNNLREYEPLTIVTYQGTSYTSKKTVPVGTELNNREYWVVTGNYNQQVEAYRQKVEELESHMSTVDETLTSIDIHGKKVLIIGDSNSDSAVVSRNWAVQFKELAENAGAEVTIDGRNGAALLATSDIPSLKSRYLSSARNFDYVIIELGVNDWLYEETLSAIDSFFVEFMDTINSETTPPELYWVMPFKTNDPRATKIPLDAYRSFYGDTCRRYGIRVIDGTNAPMVSLRYSTKYFRQDGYNIHPNELASTYIARYVYKKFLTGGDNELANYYTEYNLNTMITGLKCTLRFTSNSSAIIHIEGTYKPISGRHNLLDFSDIRCESIKYITNGLLSLEPLTGSAGVGVALVQKDVNNVFLWAGNFTDGESYNLIANIPVFINPYPSDIGYVHA